MKIRFLLISLLINSVLYSQTGNCNAEFENILNKQLSIGFEKVEKEYHQLLSICPDHYQAHTEIINHYAKYYTSIPVMALIWQNMIDPYSKQAEKNTKLITHLEERYLTFSASGSSIHVPPKFIAEWDSVFENNMSSLEAGFIIMGAINHAPKLKNSNSADKMIEGFNTLFLKIDSTRQDKYGFYYDFYVDYYVSLYKTEHFKTAIYLCMYGTREKEITNWVKKNQPKIDYFLSWRSTYLGDFKKE